MKRKLDTYFRALLLSLLVALAWSLWAGAQPGTNNAGTNTPATNSASPAQSTNLTTSALVTKFTQEHYLTFGLDRIAFFRANNFFGEPVWKYLASLVYILLAFYAAKLLDLVTLGWLKKLASNTKTRADDILLELLHGPVKIIVFVILLHLGLNIFDWSPKAKLWFSKALILIVAGSLTYLALRVVDAVLEIWRQRHLHETDHKFNQQLFSIIRRSLNTFIVIVAILVTASNIGINITAAITSLSIGGLAVGLAAQDTLANLFGAIAVYGDKPFRVGDTIKLDVAEGVVESVGMRSTRVRHPEGHLITVPNKIMGSVAISNMTRRDSIKTTMNLALARNLPTEKIKRALEILKEVYRNNPMTQEAAISFNQFAGGNINILITHWWKGTDYPRYLAGMQEMNLSVKEQFDKEGITFA
jgi:MscS family membrane protein